MIKQLFHIAFEFLFKCFFYLFMCILVIIFLSVISNYGDARTRARVMPPQSSPHIPRREKIYPITSVVTTGAVIAFALLNPNKSNREHRYNQHGED